MKRFIVLLFLAAILSGCGVWMNAEYSQLLDRTAALSHETAIRAQEGVLTEADMINALNYQADTWQKFKDAREGKD